MKLSFSNCLCKRAVETSFRVLTWNRVLIMILKPSEESIHGREDLAPVAEPFWCHCHIFYPVRSSQCRSMRDQRLLQSRIYHCTAPSHSQDTARTSMAYKLR